MNDCVNDGCCETHYKHVSNCPECGSRRYHFSYDSDEKKAYMNCDICGMSMELDMQPAPKKRKIGQDIITDSS